MNESRHMCTWQEETHNRLTKSLHEDSLGLHEDSLGRHEDSLGRHEDSLGLHEDSLGRPMLRVNTSRHPSMIHVKYEWVTSHMNESRHVWMRHVTHMAESFLIWIHPAPSSSPQEYVHAF